MSDVDFKKHFPLALTVILIAVMLVGEIIVITSSHDDYSSSISVDGDVVHFELESPGAHTYDVLSFSNTFDTPEKVYIYFDEDYQSAAKNGLASKGARDLNEKYYVQQLFGTLMVRDLENVEVVDAHNLERIMADDNPGKGYALIMLSGAIPDTVYDDESNPKILNWIKTGGRLYWVGGMIGNYISTPNDLVSVPNGTTLFLGSECVDDGKIAEDDPKVLRMIEEKDLCDELCLMNHGLSFGVIESLLPSDSVHLCVGRTDGTRCTSTLVACGDGMICIMGGDYSIRQRLDLAQIISSGIGPESVLVDHASGSVNGTAEGTVMKGDSVFVILGRDNTVFCQYHEVAG